MSYCKYFDTIYNFECLSDSRNKLNSNFASMYAGCKESAVLLNSSAETFNTLLKNIQDVVVKLNTNISLYLCQIRMSLSPTQSVPIQSITSKSLYIHPYNGDGVFLYSNKYKSWIKRTINYDVNGYALECKLIDLKTGRDLPSEKNYDVFLSWNDDEDQFVVTYQEWDMSEYGLKTKNENISLFQGVKVAKNGSTISPAKRYIGCIRTVGRGTTEQSVGGTSLQGTHPKQFVWNYYNRVTTDVGSNITSSYVPSKIFDVNVTAADIQNSWFRTYQNGETTNKFNYNRFSFIIGDYTYVDMDYQNSFITSGFTSTVYAGIGLNNDEKVSAPANTVSCIGTTTVNGAGMSFSNFQGTLKPGCYFLQTLDCTNSSTVLFNNSFNDVLKTGFTASVVN